jgi:hypothetical protein
MPALTRPNQKITFAEMRAAGVRGLLIYCPDYRCSHHAAMSGDRWPDDIGIHPQSNTPRPANTALIDKGLVRQDGDRPNYWQAAATRRFGSAGLVVQYPR